MKKIKLDTPRARARAAVLLAVAAIVLLGIVFFRMQVLRTGSDVTVQRGNRLRVLPLPAARGDILDRNGVILAGTVPATALVLMPAPADSMRARLERIAELLDLPEAWHRRAERAVLAVARPYVVTTELRPGDVGMLAASQADLPGVLLEPWPQRIYPGGHAATPVVGYVAFEPWPQGSGEDVGGVDAGHVAGRSGLELAFDSLLAGESGVRYVETDSAGRLITDPLRPSFREPRAGRPLRTKLDAPLQRYVASIMPARQRSAAVVLDVATGDVLALYSHPSQAEGADAAPENAAVALVDQPGAVFHTITAALALESGTIDVQRPATVPCRGGMRYGERYFRCWQPNGHGQLNLAGGIREGCDVYFHQLALRLGLQALLEAGARLGLDQPTGIELREERAGRYPASVTALAERLGRAPNPSDALDLGAGHGLNESTLLRMTHAYAALGAGGASPLPRLTGDSAEVPWRLELPAERTAMLLSMLDSVTAAGAPGAAAGAAMSPGTRIRGQLARARDEARLRRPTGWFVGLAGSAGAADRIAVGVLVEAAPSDETAASLAGRIADYYLRYAAGGGTPPARDTTTLPTTTVSRL